MAAPTIDGAATLGQDARGSRPRGPRRPPARRDGTQVAYALVAPAVVVLLAVLAYPMVRLVVLSFQRFDSRSLFTGEAPFVGLNNYVDVLTDPEFWTVALRTALATATVVVALMVLGFALATLLTRVSGWARLTLLVCLVLVWAMPMVSAALVWQWLFQPQYGVANWILTQVRVFGDLSAHDWFASPSQGMAIIVALIAWKALPFVVLTMYAALGQIPGELYEASGLDGASGWQATRFVTVPMMRPVLAILVVLEVIWTVNSFTPVWVLTQGGPSGGTTTLSVYAYVRAFTANDYGRGAAISLITIALLAVFAVLHVRRLAKDGEVA